MDAHAYAHRFRMEIYRLACEDFYDSFTPGDSVPACPRKPIMLPLTWYREKALIVVEKLAREGHRAPPGFDALKLADQIFGEGGEMRSNPDTPSIPKEMFEVVDYYNRLPSEAAKIQFRGAITSLANLFLKTELGIKEEDYAHHESGKEAGLKVILNQYRRYIIGEMLLGVVRLAYDVKKEHIEKILINTHAADMGAGYLNKSLKRREFAKGIAGLVKTLFGDQNLGEKISSEALK